jgi:hypothetical protein
MVTRQVLECNKMGNTLIEREGVIIYSPLIKAQISPIEVGSQKDSQDGTLC